MSSYSENVFFDGMHTWSYGDLTKWIEDGCDSKKAKKVVALRCSSCRLTELPCEIEKLVNLKYLRCYNNKLTTIPQFISKLQNLVYLDCSYNNIQSLDNIVNMPSLTHLLITENKISTISDNITRMTQLKVLFCRQNDITVFPSQLCQLINLQCFSYDEDKISMPLNVKRYIEKIPNCGLINVEDVNVYYSPSHYLCLTKQFHYVQNNSTHVLDSDIVNHVLNNDLLLDSSKRILSRYINLKRHHNILNLTFKEFFLNIVCVVSKDGKYNDFFEILNEKIEPSRYPSFNNQFMMLSRCLDELYNYKREIYKFESTQPNKKTKK